MKLKGFLVSFLALAELFGSNVTITIGKAREGCDPRFLDKKWNSCVGDSMGFKHLTVVRSVAVCFTTLVGSPQVWRKRSSKAQTLL